MSESEERLEPIQDNTNEFGIILGCWDYEKTPNLIQDLEQSITLTEFKYKNLWEEIKNYKKYLEEPGEVGFHLAVFKKNSKKSKSVFFSESEPEITFRKNRIYFQKIKRLFEEKFEKKLQDINKEIESAAHKIGLNSSIILFTLNDFLNMCEQPEHVENFELRENEEEGKREDQEDGEVDEKDEEDEENMKEKFIKLSTLEAKTKSDSLIANYSYDLDFSKITKNQLALYQKLSRLSMKNKNVKKLKINRKKAKLLLNRKSLKYHQILRTFRNRSKIPKSNKKFLKKIKNRKEIVLKNKNSLLNSARQYQCLKTKTSSVFASIETLNKSRDKEVKEKDKKNDASLGALLRKVMPFTACSSISRSYNIGLNMQQLLSLSKYRKQSDLRNSASEKINGDGKRKNIESLNLKESAISVKKMQSTPWNHLQKENNYYDKEGRRRNACVPGYVNSSNYRKVRSRNTERSPSGVFKCHKSTTSQFTTGQKSHNQNLNLMIQSQSKTAIAIGSKIMVSDCQRTFEIEKRNSFNNASGDGKGSSNNKCADLYMEWAKVYSSFLKIYRKYIYLKENISNTDSAYTNEELKSLEKDIDYSVAKYKEFLKFYTEFLHLNHRLKSLKIACETKTFEPGATFSSNCQTKVWGNKQTHSMTMKNAFREIQALQAKITLISD